MAYYPLATEVGARYSLVSPDGMTAVFNDPSDPNYVGFLTDVTGLDSADVRESAQDLTEADGGVHGNFFFSRRPVVLSGMVTGHASIQERNLRLDRARRASLALRGDSILSWRPSTRQENHVPNPNFQNGTTGYIIDQQGGTGTLGTQSAVAGPFGGQTAVVTATSAATRLGVVTSNTPIKCYPGQSLSASAYVRSAAVSRQALLIFGWYNAAGGFISSTSSLNTASSTSAWTQIPAFSAVAPAGAVQANVYVAFASVASGEVHYVDSITAAPTAFFPTGYADGTTAGWYWQGDADNSASGNYIEMFTPVRRQQPFRESGAWVKSFQIPMVSQYATLQSLLSKQVAGNVVAENRGNYPAYPIINISGSSTNPTVSDGTRVFRTTGLTLAAGETVQFDMLNHTGVFVNNGGGRNGQSANRYIDFATTAWPYLTGGGTTQTFTFTGGGTTSISVTYRDTWA